METISINQAAARFGIHARTIGRWVDAGMIRVVERPDGPGRPVLLAAADVALLAGAWDGSTGRGARQRLAKAAFQ